MKRIRHCSCRHLPERPDQLATLLSGVGLSQAEMSAVLMSLYGLPETAGDRDRRHDRALRHISVPDPNGHIHWLGPVPADSGPRVQHQHRRIPAAHWLWLRAGRPDTPLVRTCHDPECIAPDHHTQATSDRSREFVIMHGQPWRTSTPADPRINYRPKRWDHTDPTGETCLRAGHPLKVYDPRARTVVLHAVRLRRAQAPPRASRDRSEGDCPRGRAHAQPCCVLGRPRSPGPGRHPHRPHDGGRVLASGVWDASAVMRRGITT